MIKQMFMLNQEKKTNQCRTLCNVYVFYTIDYVRNQFNTKIYETEHK